jgi:hypothetical protein
MGQSQSGFTVVSDGPVPQVRLPARLRLANLETAAQALRSLER